MCFAICTMRERLFWVLNHSCLVSKISIEHVPSARIVQPMKSIFTGKQMKCLLNYLSWWFLMIILLGVWTVNLQTYTIILSNDFQFLAFTYAKNVCVKEIFCRIRWKMKEKANCSDFGLKRNLCKTTWNVWKRRRKWKTIEAQQIQTNFLFFVTICSWKSKALKTLKNPHLIIETKN